MINLLRNACEATPRGAAVLVSVRPVENEIVEILIANGGQPIAEETLSRAFEPFVNSKTGRTGFGLAIAGRLANFLGGDVELQSSADSGPRALLRTPKVA